MRFNRRYHRLCDMTKRLLHKNGVDAYTYKCGEKVPERQKELTDAQALALATCPKCFPDGAAFIKRQKQTNEKAGSVSVGTHKEGVMI